ncbi:MAG: endonuclease/exonuclease/phosphatase family protein [Proteobacteria bacterium]|nr:endonuclease/exonuclease/phosphatase family protein [Pseudomonadota bacterium]
MTSTEDSTSVRSTLRLRGGAIFHGGGTLVVGVVAISFWALSVAHLSFGDGSALLAAFHASTGWWASVAVLPVMGAWMLGRHLLALAGVVPAVLGLWWVLPGTLGAGPDVEANLRVVSSNVLMVNAVPEELLAELFAYEPDVVVLQEYSPQFEAAADPFRNAYPYSFEASAEHSFGYAVFSRLPIERVLEVEVKGVTVLEADIEVNGRTVRFANVHALPPIRGGLVADWHAELAELSRRYANHGGALVLAGDLNATRHHPSFQSLLKKADLVDGHAAVGRAAARTWPYGGTLPPLVRLDHVLVKGVVAVDVSEGHPVGTDHTPIIADLWVPPVL